MVSTVTTATVVTVSALGVSTALGGLMALVLVFFLVQRELVSSAGPRFSTLSRNLSVAIAPLVVAFGATLATRLLAMF